MQTRQISARLAPILSVFILVQILGGAGGAPSSPGERVRTYTRQIEFNYISWTIDAAFLKLGQAALGVQNYLDEKEQSEVVRNYVDLVGNIQHDEGQLTLLHANPDQAAVKNQIEAYQNDLGRLTVQRQHWGPLAESILQAQVSYILKQEDIASVGQPLPPLLFHNTPLPWALIVSPRDSIFQLANLSLETDFSLDDQIKLEDEVAAGMDVSTLVVPVGGVGTYPTMLAQTTGLNWMVSTISHEWTHNYLTWHPLGSLYFESPELTTMNETTADIIGNETGAKVIERFYPELVPPPPPPPAPVSSQPNQTVQPAEPVFNFGSEMHATRVHVDELLAAGKINEAESYMEKRRLFFWDHGYAIRKLNQAYFAFYGSYADSPIGPAGEDPVGAAVRELRSRSTSLAEFLKRMSWLFSFDDLKALLAKLN